MTEVVLLLAGLSVALAGLLALVFMRANRRSATQRTLSRTEVNVHVQEINRETLVADVEQLESSELKEESDIALLADARDEQPSQSRPLPLWHMLAIACSVPLTALVLYWFLWGRPGTVLLEEAAVYLQSGVDTETTEQIESRLQRYVAMHPQDLQAFSSLMAFQWYAGKRESFRRTHQLAEENNHVSPFGDSLYLLDVFQTKRLNLDKRDQLVRQRLREVDANAQVGSLIDALEATAKGDLLTANRAWENVLAVPDLFDLHATATLGQRATRVRLENANHPKVVVDIALNQVPTDSRWLFVYAREGAEGPPLAVVKRPLTGERRLEVVLDDSTVMRPDLLLSDSDGVRITARVSSTAEALTQIGDVEVVSDVVQPSAQPIVPLAFGSAQDIVQVKIRSEHIMSPLEPVFIIVKKQAVSTPLAVRRVYNVSASREIAITTTDLMLPNISLAAIDDLEVKARLARSQSAMAQAGDIESEAIAFSLGTTVDLTLTRVLGD